MEDSKAEDDQEEPTPSRRHSIVVMEPEPGPSRNIHIKSTVRIGSTPELRRTSDSIISLEFFKTLTRSEDEESFHTMECCLKEKETSTVEPTVFSRDPRTQNVVATRGEAPPPYDYPSDYQRPQPPSYQVYSVQQPRDVSRTPPYNINFHPESWSSISYELRNKFVQKVYTILFVQLLLTFGFIVLCSYEENIREFLKHDIVLYILFSIVWFIVYFVLICFDSARRIFPLNFLLLSLFTISMAFITAKFTVQFDTYIVMVTIGITAAVCLLISLLACQTSFDVTSCTMVIAVASLVLMVYGLIAMIIVIFTHARILFLIYACIATLLFCVYLMFDTQQILGGRRVELSPEEYILGALSLYVDIVYIFMMLLCITGFNR